MRESGRTVALAEAIGPGNPQSSSGGASRIIRMGYSADEIYTQWARQSLADWKELFARMQQPALFQHTGVLWTARPGHPHAAGTLEVFARLAIRHEVLDNDAVRRRYPQFHFDSNVMGIFEPECGALLANQAVRAVVQEAERAGVDVIPERITLPLTGISAGTVIFACGPWLPKLFPDVVGGRIHVTRQPVFYFERAPADIPVWIDFSDPRGGYAIPPVGGKSFKLALDQHGTAFDPDTVSRAVTAEETAAAKDFVEERFPALSGARVSETEVCQYENTCNGDFLIDRHPERPDVWLVGGGSGHGFKHGPAVGAYVVRMLDGGEPEARFSWRSKVAFRNRTVY